MNSHPTPGLLPLVYSCSGCSSAAQMANELALRLDRDCFAEMSCIAGVGADIPALVRVAQSGRPILAIDGCALACARGCLARAGVVPTRHLLLGQLGAKKRKHQEFDRAQADAIYQEHVIPAAAALRCMDP